MRPRALSHLVPEAEDRLSCSAFPRAPARAPRLGCRKPVDVGAALPILRCRLGPDQRPRARRPVGQSQSHEPSFAPSCRSRPVHVALCPERRLAWPEVCRLAARDGSEADQPPVAPPQSSIPRGPQLSAPAYITCLVFATPPRPSAGSRDPALIMQCWRAARGVEGTLVNYSRGCDSLLPLNPPLTLVHSSAPFTPALCPSRRRQGRHDRGQLGSPARAAAP